MSKLLVNIALGAAVGVVAGTLLDHANERVAKGKPAVPSALKASVGGLLPLAKGMALYAVAKIEQIQHEVADGGDELATDEYGDMPAQQPGGDETASTPGADQNAAGDGLSSPPPPATSEQHPAGPDFVPTPA